MNANWASLSIYSPKIRDLFEKGVERGEMRRMPAPVLAKASDRAATTRSDVTAEETY